MSEARRTLFARLRQLYARPPEEEQRARETIAAHLADREPNLLPARARVAGAEAVALFERMARRVQTDVERVAARSEVARTVARYLRYHGVPQRLRLAPHPLLEEAGFAEQSLMTVARGAADPSDPVGVTVAEAGIAETGTLMLCSSPQCPTLLAFLPETSIVLLPTAQVVGSYEEAWQLLRARYGQPPRSVNFITGPSRTGDIAQKITLGAHGPRRLLVILVEERDAA